VHPWHGAYWRGRRLQLDALPLTRIHTCSTTDETQRSQDREPPRQSDQAKSIALARGPGLLTMGLRGPWGTAGIVSIYSDVGRLESDKVPLIVPPAAVKSPYYGNNVVRAMWRQAAAALRAIDELVIMGFSLPASDQVVGSLLVTELNDKASVIPVDYSLDVVGRLVGLFGEDRITSTYAGRKENAIPDWVAFRSNIA
jgi:hypothetical protein